MRSNPVILSIIMFLLLTLCYFAHALRIQSDSVAEEDQDLLLVEEVVRNLRSDGHHEDGKTESTLLDFLERLKNGEGTSAHFRQKRFVGCDCGEGSNGCSFYKDRPVCVCDRNRFVLDGKCPDCKCENGLCDVADGSCKCMKGFGLKEDTCEKCDCGDDVPCRFVGDHQLCDCWGKFLSINLTCQECSCGTAEMCLRKVKRVSCVCSNSSGDWDATGCEDCDCSDGIGCEYTTNQIVCPCLPNNAKLDGECIDCICGENSKCSFENGTKTCTCRDGYSEKNGSCEACLCNENAKCSFINGTKMCTCKDGYEENNGTCEECFCGHGHSCAFENGSSLCICKEDHAEHGGICKECFCSEGEICEFVDGQATCQAKATVDPFDWDAPCLEEWGCSTEIAYYCGHHENGAMLFCHCPPEFADNNGTCEECDCGNDHVCTFKNGIKTCDCAQGYADNNGTCQECLCGDDSVCLFEDGHQKCFCGADSEEKDGKCYECDCGNDHTCTFKNGIKTCNCTQGYAENNGICQECLCGDDSVCLFEDGDQKCFCGADSEEKNGKCYGNKKCSESNCHKGSCEMKDDISYCLCYDGFTGPDCNREISMLKVHILLVSLVSGLVIISTAVILIKYFIERRRRYGEYNRETDKTFNVALQSLIPQTTQAT